MGAGHSDPDIIWSLILAGADINHREGDLHHGHTALTIAAHCCSSGKVIRMLTQAGANINARVNNRMDALMFAASSRASLDVFSELVRAGADVHARDEGANTVLMMLAKRWAECTVDAMDRMREVIANANEGIKKRSSYSTKEARDWLSDIESVPLMVSALLDAGAEVGCKNKVGDTALMLSVRGSGYSNVPKILIKAGANIDEQNKVGRTALIDAVVDYFHTEPRVVLAILQAGANVKLKDSAGLTALDYAKENKALAGTNALKLLTEASK